MSRMMMSIKNSLGIKAKLPNLFPLFFNYSQDTYDMIFELVDKCQELFSIGDYHYIPIYVDNELTEDEYDRLVTSKFCQNLHKYSYILDDIELGVKSAILRLSPTDKNTKTKDLEFKRDSTETDDKTITTEEDNVITKEENLNSFQMTETSPIDSTEEITSPNSKNKYNNTKNNTQTDDKGKTETVGGTFTVDRTDKETGTETDERITIDMIDKYLETRRKTSLTNMVFNVFRTVIYEFNSYI